MSVDEQRLLIDTCLNQAIKASQRLQDGLVMDACGKAYRLNVQRARKGLFDHQQAVPEDQVTCYRCAKPISGKVYINSHERYCEQCFMRATGDHEKVNHPEHYGGDTTYEAIKVIEAWGLNFNLGNLAKYLSRLDKKPGESRKVTLEKMKWYLQREIDNELNKH